MRKFSGATGEPHRPGEHTGFKRALFGKRDLIPALPTPGDFRIIVIVLLIQNLFRAVDYLTGADEETAGHIRLTYIEQAWRLEVWGFMLLAGVLCAFIGYRARKHVLVWFGHGWLAIVHIGLLIGIAVPIFLVPPFFDGIRYASVLSVVIVIHVIVMLRTGPSPLTQEERRDAD